MHTLICTPKIIQSSMSCEVTGKYKHNPGHTQWRNDCSLLCVCLYFLMAFLILHLAERENTDSTLRTWSQGKETSSLRLLFITQCHMSSPLSHFLSPLFHLSAHTASLLGKYPPVLSWSCRAQTQIELLLGSTARVFLSLVTPRRQK